MILARLGLQGKVVGQRSRSYGNKYMHGLEWSIHGLSLPSAKENHHDTWNRAQDLCLSVIRKRSQSRAARSGRGLLISFRLRSWRVFIC